MITISGMKRRITLIGLARVFGQVKGNQDGARSLIIDREFWRIPGLAANTERARLKHLTFSEGASVQQGAKK